MSDEAPRVLDTPRVLLRLRAPTPSCPEFVITIDGQSYVRKLTFEELRTLTKDCAEATMRFPVKEATE